ncbi:hypothetical protein GGR42_001860 [Saonia flava]|uniref:Uncharacterized protein n=1 Tax=Saonia flava TaxID=523696 RepID=A0A846QTM0_9FLAO|nr:hypothetical protein [Saonia flava]NJB71398.1 hypothetical protein [Saonia flava]
MKRKLKEELVKMSTDIITSRNLKEIPELYEAAKGLYEKLAVLKFIDEKLNDIEIDVSNNVVASKFEKMANAVMNENTSVPENNPHDEDIMVPGMDTIKHMVSEMPNDSESKDAIADFLATPNLMKNDKELFMPEAKTEQKVVSKPKSLNDRLIKDMQVGLNDKLAFIKHLFNDSTEDYNRVLSQLNTIDTEERSISFINNLVKPEYDNWAGKEEVEDRFIALITRKFS